MVLWLSKGPMMNCVLAVDSTLTSYPAKMRLKAYLAPKSRESCKEVARTMANCELAFVRGGERTGKRHHTCLPAHALRNPAAEFTVHCLFANLTNEEPYSTIPDYQGNLG
mmetsp:Transcript_34347/g.78725  ORF Transcript_34347/g.78725 Transcript_34347/m.78725 type:complete len:110 (+) Transcript_34347:280-609(+)